MVELAWRSPLEHRRGANGSIELRAAGVQVSAGPRAAAVLVRGDAGQPAFAQAFAASAGVALPMEPNTAVGTDPRAIWLAPDAWLVSSAAGDWSTLAPRLRAARPPFAQVIDLGDGQTRIDVAGRCAPKVLAKGCDLDLESARFGEGRCARTLFARVPALIDVREPGIAYHVHVESSLVDYLWRWCAEALREFGS